MYANDTATLNEAIASAKSGNKAAAHVTLAALRSHYPTNPDVLLWLAYTADTSHEARGILDTLAWTDPNNADLKRARMWLAEWEFSATAGQPARHAQPEYAEPTEQSSHVAQPHAISDTQPFVLNLKNQDYLAGRTRKPSLGKNQGGAIFLVLFFSLFGGVGFFVVAASLNESLTKDRMLKTGTAVQATITKLEIDTSGDSTSYDVTYRFIAGNPPRTYNRSQSVNATTYYRYTEGQTTSVHYDPKAPSTSRIDGADDNSFVAYFIGGLFALIGIGGIYAAISYGSKTRALRQRGQLLRGTITRVTTREDSDDNLNLDIRYTFVAPDDQEVEGKHTGIDNDFKRKRKLLATGTPVVVFTPAPTIIGCCRLRRMFYRDGWLCSRSC